ncbi:hypothetical protein BDR22DRAFT_867554 [Usnea florida]
MTRHGPRDQGRPPGEQSSYGAKHLSDAEDSLVVRKKNLHPQSRGRLSSSDSIGSYSEDDRPMQDYDDDEDDGTSLGSRLAGDDAKGLQDLEAHYKNIKFKNLGPNFPYDDHDDMDVNDIGRLRMHRDIRSEQVKHARTPAEREFFAEAVEMINEDIARFEYKERQLAQAGGLGLNPHQNRTGGSRGSPDGSRNPSGRFELSQLEKDLQSEMRNASRFAESGDNYGLQMAEANVEELSEIVERLQLESRQGGKVERGMGRRT